jgi:nuclear receptor interaction protein
MMGDETWGRMDRVQVLGNGSEGHRGLVTRLVPCVLLLLLVVSGLSGRSCVNALSWSDDGSTLLSGSDDKRYAHARMLSSAWSRELTRV